MSEFFSPDFLFRNAILGGLGVALLCSILGHLRGAAAAGADRRRAPAGRLRRDRRRVLARPATRTTAAAGRTCSRSAARCWRPSVRWRVLVAGQRRSRSPAEWGVGALFAISSAATILFVA